ncbi:NAD(P)H-binding protein [Leptospira vanthielii]|uniref:IRF tryptophan pentad repeat domain-containing protein n=1 Tax=Leptospira vanthielii TaxID=293085 RepID=A0ABY2NQ74_9LEPT|nr:NAD(P)H-binding protein [Leptospira vanthielii]TGM58255.1 hypothetical protein EHQ95_08270 [Leptospira vanthielii]
MKIIVFGATGGIGKLLLPLLSTGDHQVTRFSRNRFKDHLGQEKLITESGLDFTIIRPGNFFDGPLTNQYLHGRTEDIPKYKLAYKISKADLVDFILKQINSNQYNREVTWISNAK